MDRWTYWTYWKSLLKLISNSGDYQIITEIRKNLDLTNTSQVDHFISKKPDCIFISAGKVGGIEYNSLNPFDFLYENSLINFNILKVHLITISIKL